MAAGAASYGTANSSRSAAFNAGAAPSEQQEGTPSIAPNPTGEFQPVMSSTFNGMANYTPDGMSGTTAQRMFENRQFMSAMRA